MFRFLARSLTSALLFLSLIASTSPLFAQGGKITGPDKYNQDRDEKEAAERDRVRERHEYFMKGRRVKGQSSAALLARAHKQKLQLRDFNRKRLAQLSSARATVGARGVNTGTGLPGATPAFSQPWVDLGPTPIDQQNSGYGDVTGRLIAITVDPSDATGNTVLAGGANGGVWKSTNALATPASDVTWTPMTDTQASLAASAISIKPGTSGSSQVILVGTGEPHFSGDSYYGLGILRSTDGGATWTLIQNASGGSFIGMGVSKFAWSTSNPNVVIAGLSSGSLADSGSNPGFGLNDAVYYSNDSGATWTKASNPDLWFPVSDVVWSASANKFIAAVFQQGFYSSTDGANWTRLSPQPVPSIDTSAGCGLAGNCDMSRGHLAVNGTGVYAIAIASSGKSLKGIARSTNGGVSWTILATTLPGGGAGNAFGQAIYDVYIAAVPNGANTDIFVGLIDIFRCDSANTAAAGGCNTATNLTDVYGTNPRLVHPDQHSFNFVPTSPNIIYMGNDGGLYRSLDRGNTVQNLNSHLGSLSQINWFSQHPSDKEVMLAGLQDNGSPARDSAHFGPDEKQWVHIAGGDGGYNAIDPVNPAHWYGSLIFTTIHECPVGDTSGACIPGAFDPRVCNAAGTSYTNGECPTNFPDATPFYTTWNLDPGNHGKLVIGSCKVWRGNADGTGWGAASTANALSNQLSNGNIPNNCGGGEAAVRSLGFGGTVNSNGSPVIYAGYENGQLWVTTNANIGLATWNLQSGGWAGFPVSDIAVKDGNSGNGLTAFATIMGFGTGHVWKTINGGANWTNISGNLPDVPADSIAIDPGDATGNTLYVGTDLGVFYTTDGGANWVEYGPASGAGAFPSAPVTRLLTFNVGGQKLLRASTYGRGVWQNALATSVTPDFSISISNPSLSGFAGQVKTFNGTLNFLNGYNGTVNLSCTPGGTAVPSTCSAIPTSRSSAGAFSVDAASNSTQVFSFKIHATDGVLSHDFPVTLDVSNYGLSVTSSQPMTVLRGTSSAATVKVQATGTFTGPVTVSCDAASLPGGVSCTPITLTPPQNSFATGSLTVTANTLASVNGYTLTLDGQTAGVTRTTPLQIDLQQNSALFDFVLAVTPLSRTVAPSASAGYTVNILPTGGFNGTVNLTCQIVGTPTGTACSFDQTSISADSVAHLTVDTGAGTPASTYTVHVTGMFGVKSHTQNVSLIVNTSDFTMNGAPGVVVTHGDANGTGYLVTLSPVNGFASGVFLTCGGLPTDIQANADVTCSSGGATVPAGGMSPVTFKAGSGTPAGIYNVQVIGYSLSPYVVHAIPVTLTVQ